VGLVLHADVINLSKPMKCHIIPEVESVFGAIIRNFPRGRKGGDYFSTTRLDCREPIKDPANDAFTINLEC
jgi:hypothetical protein